MTTLSVFTRFHHLLMGFILWTIQQELKIIVINTYFYLTPEKSWFWFYIENKTILCEDVLARTVTAMLKWPCWWLALFLLLPGLRGDVRFYQKYQSYLNVKPGIRTKLLQADRTDTQGIPHSQPNTTYCWEILDTVLLGALERKKPPTRGFLLAPRWFFMA